MGIIKILKALCCTKLVNCIIEAVQENLLTSFSTAKEVSAWINLLIAVQIIADSWQSRYQDHSELFCPLWF
jgi:hypothetical protein